MTISGHGIAPLVSEYTSVPASIDWDGRDGDGAQAPYGDYDVMLEAWDLAGNYNVTYGIIHLLPPPPETQPTEVPQVIVESMQAPTKAPDPIPVEPMPELPQGLPLWALVLPIGALGVWLAGSNVALARERRFLELRGIRQTVGRYRDQKKINFPQEGEE